MLNLQVSQISNKSAFISYIIVALGVFITLLLVNAFEARSDGKHQVPPRKNSKFYLLFYSFGCKYVMKQIAKQISSDNDSGPILH